MNASFQDEFKQRHGIRTDEPLSLHIIFKLKVKNKQELVTLFLKEGANINEADEKSGETPLFLAVVHGDLQVVMFLVEHGANLDLANIAMISPLMIAVILKLYDIVEYLLIKGADREKVDARGWTPLHCAIDSGFHNLMVLLMHHNANVHAKTNDGKLPIQFASDPRVKRLIREETRRRMDEAPSRKRCIDPIQMQQVEDEENQQSNNQPRLDVGAAAKEMKAKVASEDEDSETSSDEEDDR